MEERAWRCSHGYHIQPHETLTQSVDQNLCFNNYDSSAYSCLQFQGQDPKYCDEHACSCLSVCLSVCLLPARLTRKSYGRTCIQFYACCLRSWHGPPLAALRYVIISGFVDDVVFSHSGFMARRISSAAIEYKTEIPTRFFLLFSMTFHRCAIKNYLLPYLLYSS